MFRAIRLIGSLLFFTTWCSTGHADTLRNFKVGSWFAGAYSSDETKRFSHCAGSAPYVSGIVMLFSINRNYQWSVGFLSEKFNLPPQESIKVGISIDYAPPTTVTAY